MSAMLPLDPETQLKILHEKISTETWKSLNSDSIEKIEYYLKEVCEYLPDATEKENFIFVENFNFFFFSNKYY